MTSTLKPQIELYDLGRCTHKPIPGMYEFIVNHAGDFVADVGFARELQDHAANREKPGYSVPQAHFTEMCRIWVEAYRSGAFPIDIANATFPDTVTRFRDVKSWGRNIGILTSGSREFTEILYDLPVKDEHGNDRRLADFVDEYLLGEEIGDKDHPETFAHLWDRTEGNIWAIYDDKVSVCEAATNGLEQHKGDARAGVRIWLVDRKGKYAAATGELADRVRELQERRVRVVRNFDEVTAFELGGDE